jgi:hypothetical protein
MTNEPDSTHSAGGHSDDAYEQMARDAGAALRRPAPSDGVARLRSARRRQQVVRTAIAGGTTAIIVVVGLVVINRRSDQTVTPGDTVAATSATTTSTTSQTTSTTVIPTTTIPAAASLEYTLTGVDGLVATNEPGSATLENATGPTSLIIAWSVVTGVADGFIVLNETRGSTGATEPEGDMTSVPIDVPDGHAYLVTDNDADGQPMALPSATRLMWWRADGRLWIVSNYEVAPERLTQLALAIQPGSGLPYVLPEAGMSFIGFNAPESYEAVTQEWSLDGSSLVLSVSTGGLVQQLADTVIVSVAERTIADGAGYSLTLPNGQVNLVWPTADPDRWGSLIVSPPLAPRIDEIIAAVTPV